MTGKTISINSSRGGTGKTVIATNMAVVLAKEGLNVALFDMDFRAPSLATVFSKQLKGEIEYWLNDYLNGKCSAQQAVRNIPKSNLKGHLYVGFANPSVKAITNIMEKSQAWEVSAIKKLFLLREVLFNEMKVDYCIFDTSPGIQYSSVNAAIASDLCIVVTTLDMLDMKGAESLLKNLYDNVAKKTVVLINKVFPETCPWPNDRILELVKITEANLNHKVIGIIPCYCNVLQAGRISFFAEERPFHPFLKNLEDIVGNIKTLISG
jgi:MinD-like ATPase involved in chromosome partitioning or flagellar assembly